MQLIFKLALFFCISILSHASENILLFPFEGCDSVLNKSASDNRRTDRVKHTVILIRDSAEDLANVQTALEMVGNQRSLSGDAAIELQKFMVRKISNIRETLLDIYSKAEQEGDFSTEVKTFQNIIKQKRIVLEKHLETTFKIIRRYVNVQDGRYSRKFVSDIRSEDIHTLNLLREILDVGLGLVEIKPAVLDTRVQHTGNTDREEYFQLLERFKLQPRHTVNFSNPVTKKLYRFSFTDFFRIDSTRVGTLAIVETAQRKYLRVFYRSGSQGIFRLLPAVNIDVIVEMIKRMPEFDKADSEDTLAVNPIVQKAFFDVLSRSTNLQEIPDEVYRGAVKVNLSEKDFKKYKNDTSEFLGHNVTVRKLLLKAQSGQPLTVKGKKGIIKKRFPLPEELLTEDDHKPDFSREVRELSFRAPGNGILPESFGMYYPSYDNTILYLIQKMKYNGQWYAWISNPFDATAEINEFGVPNIAIDLGEATMPVWEYEDQIPDEYRGEIHPQNMDYFLANRYLERIEILHDWYRSQGLPLPSKNAANATLDFSSVLPIEPIRATIEMPVPSTIKQTMELPVVEQKMEEPKQPSPSTIKRKSTNLIAALSVSAGVGIGGIILGALHFFKPEAGLSVAAEAVPSVPTDVSESQEPKVIPSKPARLPTPVEDPVIKTAPVVSQNSSPMPKPQRIETDKDIAKGIIAEAMNSMASAHNYYDAIQFEKEFLKFSTTIANSETEFSHTDMDKVQKLLSQMDDIDKSSFNEKLKTIQAKVNFDANPVVYTWLEKIIRELSVESSSIDVDQIVSGN